MTPEPRVSIIIPTFNEEKNIVELLDRIHAVLPPAGIPYECIVVDDGSSDATRALVRSRAEGGRPVQLIARDTERGLASAMIAGYRAARGPYLAAMDADLAHDPAYLPEMIRFLDDGRADMVIGSRYLPGSRFEGKPFMNKLASIVGQTLIQIILGVTVRDTSNNFRVFRRQVWEAIKHALHPDGNIMLTEIVYQAGKRGFRIVEIPIVYTERRHGKSKLSIAKETMRFFKNIRKIKRGG